MKRTQPAVINRFGKWTGNLFLAVIGLVCPGKTAWAADESIVLTEHLNRRWSHEWVACPFAAKQGACAKDSIQLTGPRGALAVQLSGVEFWPGTEFVKKASLSFVVDELAPLTTNNYTVSYGAKATARAAVAADLAITKTADRVEVTTSRFGARLLLGEKKYDPPAAAAAVPGPVLGMRLAAGTWFGGSRLFGDARVAGYSARITDSGRVFVRVECSYRYADGRTNTIGMQFNAQGDRLYFNDETSALTDTEGWDLTLGGLPPLALQYMPEQIKLQPKARVIDGGWKELAIADCSRGPVATLVPWGDWWDETTQTTLLLAFLDTRTAADEPRRPSLDGVLIKPEPAAVNLDDKPTKPTDGRELVVRRLDAGAWVRPEGGSNQQRAAVPLMKAEDGSLFLHVNGGTHTRIWTVGESPSYRAKLGRLLPVTNVMQDDVEDLNVVKDMVLDWPATGARHPHLFLSAEEMKAAGAREPAALKKLLDVTALRSALASFVGFDSMRKSADVICHYDALIDSDLITPAERKLFRAQMAYLAYRLASPANWSPERGFNSGNPNMTVAHVLNQGLMASVLSDHPMAKAWSEKPVASMNAWMDRIDAAGHWPESSGYARVSESKFIYYAIAAQRAGLHDFLSDPRFKRMVAFYERTMTPPDPMRVMGNSPKNEPHHPRVTPPYGRGGNGQSVGLGGVVAKAMAKIDPALSRMSQWNYAAGLFSAQTGEPMAGYDQLLTDPTLPTERPDWRSELLPSIGALFRSGLGTPEENYVFLVTKNPTNPDGEIWPSEVGAVEAWFARGKPLTRTFPPYPYENSHGLLQNRVMLATNWKPGESAIAGYTSKETMTGFATLPRLDYIGESYQWQGGWNFWPSPPKGLPAFPKVPKAGALPASGQPPVTWQRQALHVRDDAPGGMNYLVLRDTVTGGQPTQWQFWTLSQKLSGPGGTSPFPKLKTETLEDIISDDKPKATATLTSDMKTTPPSEARTLQGDRFTAIGQHGMDLDYFIASPTNTPRNTLRFATISKSLGVVGDFPFEQDLLHLQLPGDGNYFVALVPRGHAEAAPIFATLGDGRVIKVSGAFGTDYAFLADARGAATSEGAVFAGTVASVQDRKSGLVLALGAEGSVAFKSYGITAPAAASLRVDASALTVALPAQHAGCEVIVTAPEGWTLDPSIKGVTVAKTQKGAHQLTIPAGVTEARLVKRK